MSRLAEYHTQFVQHVARGRGVQPGTVELNYGQGRVLGSTEALRVGMVDDVAPTLEAALANNRMGRGGRAALNEQQRIAAQRAHALNRIKLSAQS